MQRVLYLLQVQQCMVAIYINASVDSKHRKPRKLIIFIVVFTNGNNIFIMYHTKFSKLNDDSKSMMKNQHLIKNTMILQILLNTNL